MMLPQLEQNSMYNATNFSLGNNMPNSYGFYANSTVTGTRITVYLCPSDPNAGSTSVLRTADNRNDMLDLSYVASAGTTTNSPNNTAPTNALGDPGEYRAVLVVHQLWDPKRHGRHLEHRRLFRGPGEQLRGVERGGDR